MKYFLDCGYYAGKAIEYYAPFLDDSWTVIAFEPNEDLDVEKSIQRFKGIGFKWVHFLKAVWVEDTNKTFKVGGREDASCIKDLHPNEPENIAEERTVACVDFSKFVAELPRDATIVCSMDIEGAEFPVLRKLLADGTASRLSLLDVEFHHRLLDGENEASASWLRQQLEGEGVLVKLKIPLE